MNKINDWYDIVRVVLQGSILDPLLFYLFINDAFLFTKRTNICNFADDNTIYSCQNNVKTVLEDLRYHLVTLLKWLKEIQRKLIQKKKNSWY